MKKRLLPAVIFTLAAIFGFAALNQGIFAAKTQTANLVSVKGKVAVQVKGQAAWQAATEKMSVSEGDVVKTSAGASVIVKLGDGSMIKVGPLSNMTIGKLSTTGKSAETQLNVQSGKTWARVRKLNDESKFHVKTPTAVAGVRGTFFSSEAQESSSAFDVFDGEVEVASASNPSQTVSVKANQRTTVASDKAPAAPSAIPAADATEGRGGFNEQEYTSATFEIQISVSPQVVQPGEKATVSIQVFKNGAPYNQEVNLRLTLGGSALFADGGANTIDTVTDSKGAVTLQITDPVEESITVDAAMSIKVKK